MPIANMYTYMSLFMQYRAMLYSSYVNMCHNISIVCIDPMTMETIEHWNTRHTHTHTHIAHRTCQRHLFKIELFACFNCVKTHLQDAYLIMAFGEKGKILEFDWYTSENTTHSWISKHRKYSWWWNTFFWP